jgi:hypothetical protein
MKHIFSARAVRTSKPWILATVLALAVMVPRPVLAAGCAKPWNALIRLAAAQIDRVFGDVAASTRALAGEYVALSDSVPPATPAERDVWLKHYQAKGRTVGFQSWSGDSHSPPSFQAPYPSYYDYNGTAFTDDTFRQLEIFKRLTPVFRAAYRSFGFSWVYVTTAQGKMMIYPYLPITEAVNNEYPTKQVYYTSADFKNRDVGWTLPYLDLVGAGMMITVSCPVYNDDTLLGVVSRDITLKQLSSEVLSHLVVGAGAVAFIVDRSGLVIGVSDPGLARELDRVNSKAAAAVLHYRTQQGLKRLGSKSAQASASAWINQVTETLLAREAKAPASAVIRFVRGGREVLAARTARTGWYVVSAVPE